MKLIQVDQEGRLLQVRGLIKYSLSQALIPFGIFAALLFFPLMVVASAGAPPQTFTLDGQFFADTAMTIPLLDSSVLVDIKIFDSTKMCLIYEESQVIDTASTGGYFNLKVGSETLSGGKRTSSNDPGNPMAAIFQNLIPVFQSMTTVLCPMGYAPTAFATRTLRVTISTSAGITETFADMTMDAVPNAFVAETVQGLGPANIVQTDSASLTQANVANIFSSTNYAQLVMLLSGSSNQYVARAADGTASLPSLSSNPSGASAGQIWFDSSGSAVKYYDGVTVRTLGTSGGSVSSVATGAGLTGGAITSTGTISIASAGVVSSMLGSGAVTASKLDPAISISTTGTVTAANAAFVGVAANYINLYASGSATQFVQLSAPATANYPLILPAANGAAGSVLANDGSGNLSWALGGAGGSGATASTSQWISSTGGVISYSSGNVAIGTTSAPNLLTIGNSGGTQTIPNVIQLNNSGYDNPSANGGASNGDKIVFWNEMAVHNIKNAIGNDPYGLWLQASGDASSHFTVWTGPTGGAAPLERMRIDANGHFGIGTVSPGKALEVWGTGTGILRVGDTAAGNTFDFYPNGTSTVLANNGVGALKFWTNGSERVHLESNGNLGVGNLVPSTRLDVAGNGLAASTTYDLIRAAEGSTGKGIYLSYSTNPAGTAVLDGRVRTSGGQNLALGTGNFGSAIYILDSNGNVGIGTNVAGAILDVNGTGTSQSAMIIPRDTTGNRPTSAVNGMIRYNTSLAQLEGYVGGAWAGLSGGTGSSTSSGTAGTIQFSNGSGGFSGDTTNFVWDSVNARLGVGTNAPASPVDVQNLTTSTSGSYNAINAIQRTNGGSVSNALIRGAFIEANTSNGNVSPSLTAIGAEISGQNSSTGYLNSVTGVSSYVLSNSSGIITTGKGVEGYAKGGGSAITNGYGGYFYTLGSVTNAYGVYIGTMAGTTKYSLYASDATAPNYFAGSVGIGTTTPAGALDVSSTTSGFLPPRMTTAQRTAIASPVNGMIVFDSTAGGLFVYNGGWQQSSGSASSSAYGSSTALSSTVGQNGSTLIYQASVTVAANEVVFILGQLDLYNAGTLDDTSAWIGRDGTALTTIAEAAVSAEYASPHAVFFIDTPGAGTYNYQIWGTEVLNRISPTVSSGALRVQKFAGGGLSGPGNTQWTTNGSNINYLSGSVGIGTTSPGTSLDVPSGPIRPGAATSGASCSALGATAYSSATGAPLYCSNSSVWTPVYSTASCSTVTNSSSTGNGNATCSAGTHVTGGGCGNNGGVLNASAPAGNGWTCTWSLAAAGTIYAICCP